MYLGTLPLHCVQGVHLHCISEPTGCIKSLCKKGKACFNRRDGYYSNWKKKKWSGSYCFMGGGSLCYQPLGPNYSFVPVPLKVRSQNEKEKQSALPYPLTRFHVTEVVHKVSTPQHYRQFGWDNCLFGWGWGSALCTVRCLAASLTSTH